MIFLQIRQRSLRHWLAGWRLRYLFCRQALEQVSGLTRKLALDCTGPRVLRS